MPQDGQRDGPQQPLGDQAGPGQIDRRELVAHRQGVHDRGIVDDVHRHKYVGHHHKGRPCRREAADPDIQGQEDQQVQHREGPGREVVCRAQQSLGNEQGGRYRYRCPQEPAPAAFLKSRAADDAQHDRRQGHERLGDGERPLRQMRQAPHDAGKRRCEGRPHHRRPHHRRSPSRSRLKPRSANASRAWETWRRATGSLVPSKSTKSPSSRRETKSRLTSRPRLAW